MTLEKISVIFIAGLLLWFVIKMLIWMFKGGD